jgi:hypothetical protein
VPKPSALRLKRKKEGEPAFSAFIGFYFVYRAFGICGLFPGTGEARARARDSSRSLVGQGEAGSGPAPALPVRTGRYCPCVGS